MDKWFRKWLNKQKEKLGPMPSKFIIPNPYNVPGHVQGKENNCSTLAWAFAFKLELSEIFKERTTIDVDDLWRKQLKYGTATKDGDFVEAPFLIAQKYGVKFKPQRHILHQIYLLYFRDNLYLIYRI